MTTATQTIPKGYKQTDIGIIPADWDVKQLGDLFDITSSKRVFQSEWQTRGVPFYRARELAVLSETGSVDNELFISPEMYRAFKNSYGVPQTGDILVTGVGTLGKVYVVPGDHDFYFKDGNIIWFKIAGKVNSNFLRQLYLTRLITKQIEDASAGTTVGTYTITGAKKTTIPYPSKEEQTAIATALSDADALITKLKALIEKKRNIKQGAMQELLTGKIRLPGFTGKWTIQKLASLGSFRGGSGFPLRYQGVKGGDYPFYKVSDMNNEGNSTFMFDSNHWISETVRKQSGANTFPVNTIVFAKIGAAIFLERKKILSRESCIDNNMMGFILNEIKVNPRFIHYLFHNIKLGKLVSATALPSLNGKGIGELIFGIPELPEQTAIASVLSDMDAEIEKLESELTKYRNIKQGMMQNLLTGKIRLITK